MLHYLSPTMMPESVICILCNREIKTIEGNGCALFTYCHACSLLGEDHRLFQCAPCHTAREKNVKEMRAWAEAFGQLDADIQSMLEEKLASLAQEVTECHVAGFGSVPSILEAELRRIRTFYTKNLRTNSPNKISLEDIELVKSKVSPEPFLDTPVDKHAGRWFYLCPFHEEDTASFIWFEAFGRSRGFHCFGCQAHGSIIDLYMRLENVKFSEAVRELKKFL